MALSELVMDLLCAAAFQFLGGWALVKLLLTCRLANTSSGRRQQVNEAKRLMGRLNTFLLRTTSLDQLQLPGFKKRESFVAQMIPVDDLAAPPSYNFLDVLMKTAALNPRAPSEASFAEWVDDHQPPARRSLPMRELVAAMNGLYFDTCEDFCALVGTLGSEPAYARRWGPTLTPVQLPNNRLSYTYPAILICYCDLRGFPFVLLAHSKIKEMPWTLTTTTSRPTVA